MSNKLLFDEHDYEYVTGKSFDECFSSERFGHTKTPAHPVRNELKKNYAEILKTIERRDGVACKMCGSEDNTTIDHIVPISRGGTNEIDNLQILCKPCNSRKGARL